MVLRGDFQVCNDPDEYDDAYENEWLSEEAERDTDWAESYVLSLKYRAKSYGEVGVDADDDNVVDDTVEMNFDGIYDVLAEVQIIDADKLSDLSSDDDDDS